jgi:precorrin-6A/cobalt-precorrin-6A reductase
VPASRILILGGTADARALADTLADRSDLHVISSLAGRTQAPVLPRGDVRSGGFGGADGLGTYLSDAAIDLVVDATHPFAAQISAHAHDACAAKGIPYVRLERPAWHRQTSDRWQSVTSVAAAAAALGPGETVLVTVGRQELAPFAARTDFTVIARMIEPPEIEVPAHMEILLARPPFSEADERTLFGDRSITVLVCKNSGGEATMAKLAAARTLQVPVLMVERPAKPPARTAQDAAGMVDLVDEILDHDQG